MGLRCLMGHDFGEVLTDRDRHERGNEVVVTITEYRECERCGQTRVVSENKEVRHAGPSDPDASEDDAGSEVESGDALGVSAGASQFEDEDISAEDDDGLILEDEPAEPEAREPGAWPESETEAPPDDEDDAEPTPWPEVEGEDEGFSASPSDGGGVEGVQFDSGLTPEASASGASGSSGDGGDVVESSRGSDTGGFHRSASIPSSSGRQRSEEADTEFFCPECEHTTPTDGSSLRPGDICPNCHLGYLTERAR